MQVRLDNIKLTLKQTLSIIKPGTSVQVVIPSHHKDQPTIRFGVNVAWPKPPDYVTLCNYPEQYTKYLTYKVKYINNPQDYNHPIVLELHPQVKHNTTQTTNKQGGNND